MTLICHVPSCDQLCRSQPVAVLPVRRCFLLYRPSLADGSPDHCRTSRWIVRSSCEKASLLHAFKLRSDASSAPKIGKPFVLFRGGGYNMNPSVNLKNDRPPRFFTREIAYHASSSWMQ